MLLAKGKSETEILEALVIERGTLYSHLARIYQRLGVHTRGAAIAAFLKQEETG